MELFIAILMYLGILSPEASSNMSAAEMEYLLNCNQDAINCVLQDPGHVEAVSAGFEIDRRED